MVDSDLDYICSVEQSAYEFPWSRAVFESCMGDGYHSSVMLDGNGKIIAYGIVFSVADEAQLLNLCVVPRMQGLGAGRSMLFHLLASMRHNRVKSLFLEVRVSNERAINLYNRSGFSEIGRRKGYYPAHKGREDAIVMMLDLTDLNII